MQMFMYVPMAANVTQTTEGSVGTAIQVSVLSTTATIGEYAKHNLAYKNLTISVKLSIMETRRRKGS
jgi:hypothetical protein